MDQSLPKNNAPLPHGLTGPEVELLLKKYGRNEIVPSALGSHLSEVLRFFKDPMGLMLLALALIYFLLGETRDAVIMLIAFVPVSTIDVFLELRAQKALKSLKATFQPTAKVFRAGVLREIPIQEIVPQDWIALEEGQTIPADGVVTSGVNLSLNEAALTGESVPVEKSMGDEVFAGTTILAGRGIYQVSQTGKHTKFGKIVELLETAEEGQSPLQLKVKRLVAKIMKLAAVLVVLLFIIEWLRGKSLLKSLLISLTFGMASVPEEFPLVFTLYLSLGAWRLAKSGVLVKALPSVETLGSVNVICTDKTGTLTEGKFQLGEMVSFTQKSSDELWHFALLACEPVIVDSMERAIQAKCPPHVSLQSWHLIHDYEFESVGKHMSHAWKNASGEAVVAMKGAVEGVLSHCVDSAERKTEILRKTTELSSQGFRLLGLAGKTAPITGVREQDEAGLSFFAILCFSDPIRSSAKAAIVTCQQQGIVVKMITGDHPLTAHAIADQLGLLHSHDALYTGSELALMDAPARGEAFQRGAIFSRVTPEQKYELVKALKQQNLIVAMTGDGVNDAPALKVADIGISMGANATDAARSTAKMVLTQSDFSGIVTAITVGKQIFSNLRKSFAYLISFHTPVVLLSFLPPILGLGELLLPMHIILLEMIVHPVSAFTFENLSGSPDKKVKGLIDQRVVMTSMLAGVLVSLAALGLYLFHGERTLAVVTILFGNIGFILLETWPVFTKRLLITLGVLFVVTVSTFTVPAIMQGLHLAPLSLTWALLSLGLALLGSLPSWFLRGQRD